MLAMFLSILKIIGIVILWILLVVLIIILLILFWPITYKGTAKRTEAEGDPPFVLCFKAKWLLGFLNVYAGWPGDPNVRVRICLHELFRMPDNNEKTKNKKNKKKSKFKKKNDSNKNKASNEYKKKNNNKTIKDKTDNKDTIKDVDNIDYKENLDHIENKQSDQEAIHDHKTETPCERKTEYCIHSSDIHENHNSQESDKHEKEDFHSDSKTDECGTSGFESERSTENIISRIFSRIRYTLKKIYDKINSIYEKTCDIRKDIKYYYDIITCERFGTTFERCKKLIFKIIHQLLPRYFYANIIEGTGDPESTAKVLAVWGMLYPLIGDKVNITGDFENTTIKADIRFHGRITIFVVVYCGLRLYFDKDARNLIKMFKKEE